MNTEWITHILRARDLEGRYYDSVELTTDEAERYLSHLPEQFASGNFRMRKLKKPRRERV